jgi:hypothetical protein
MSVLRICIPFSFRCVAGRIQCVSHSCGPIVWARTKQRILGALLNVITFGFPYVVGKFKDSGWGGGLFRRRMCFELVLLVVTWLAR